jgi:hypothetical protein
MSTKADHQEHQAAVAAKQDEAAQKYQRREARVRSLWFSIPQMAVVPALGAIIALAAIAPIDGAPGDQSASIQGVSGSSGMVKRQQATPAAPVGQLEAKVHWGALL